MPVIESHVYAGTESLALGEWLDWIGRACLPAARAIRALRDLVKRAAKKCVKAWKWSVATVPPVERMVLLRDSRWSVLKQVENRTRGFCLQPCRPAIK